MVNESSEGDHIHFVSGFRQKMFIFSVFISVLVNFIAWHGLESSERKVSVEELLRLD